ncbi:MAG: hypothetical protein EU542_09020, partial [Promethearchaeota archaeon]
MSETVDLHVAEERRRKMKNLLLATRIFALLVFLGAYVLVLTAIDPVVWNFQSFWYGLKFFIFLFEIFLLLIGYALALLFGYGDDGAVAIMEAIHIAIFGGNQTILGIQIESLITRPLQLPSQQNLIDAIYAFLIMTLAFVCFISAVGFIRECNPVLSTISFFSMNFMLGLAALNNKLLISLDFHTQNFVGLIFSQTVITAFLIYFALELSFQASYVYRVIGPNIERHRRILSNIKRVKEFELSSIQQPVKSATTSSKNQLSGKSENEEDEDSFSITTAFSQFKALIGKKLFKINQGEEWDKVTLRLKNFYEQLEEDDPFISISLSASAYTPSTARLILIITSGTLFRMIVLSGLTWVALNPVPVLTALNLPESVINSVEASQPEMILLVLAPLATIFLVIGFLIMW